MQTLSSGSTIGILGSGQLGRMLALAASALDLKTHIYSPDAASPASQVTDKATQGAYDDTKALKDFATQVDIVTCEFENVPHDTAAFLAQFVPVRPDARALDIAQDRLAEKNFIRAQNIAVTDFADITSLASLTETLEKFGGDGILKTRRFGYDGKGQWRITSAAQAQTAFDALQNRAAILESPVAFDREISIIAARGADGDIRAFDCAENIHQNHILKHSYAPAQISAATHQAAHDIAVTLLNALNYIGVLGVELFVCGQKLLVNEIAPRVHNSGHWTQDACRTCQFEQHIRAIAGWPLGDTTRNYDAVMTNLLGDEINQLDGLAQEKNARLHHYGKTTARAGRKMGHVNHLYPLGQRPAIPSD